jgi:hypothetical protein
VVGREERDDKNASLPTDQANCYGELVKLYANHINQLSAA